MKNSFGLILSLTAALSLGVIACGDDEKDKDPVKVECTSDAQCADRTDGKTKCDTVAQ